MKTRDQLLLLTVLVLLATLAGLMLAGAATHASGEAPPTALGPAPAPPPEHEPGGLVVAPAPEAASKPLTHQPDRPAIERTSGVVRGDITLDASVVAKLNAVFIRVREQGPLGAGFDRTQKIEIIPEFGTPTFTLEDVPFSEKGYAVSATAPGCNGSEQIVQVTEDTPIADVRLGVTAGVAFSVILRDQHRAPVTDLNVTLVPEGRPLNRRPRSGRTDNFGSAVFTDLLQGGYRVIVGPVDRPRAEPVSVQVLAHAGPSAVTIEVPHGVALEALVSAKGGWGLPGAKVELLKTDSVRLRKFEGTTDHAGRHVFEHLLPGSYQVNITKDDFRRWTRNLVVKAEPGQRLEVGLTPKR